VLVTDPNFGHLRKARAAGIPTFSGDILSEAAEHRVEFINYGTLICATDNDAYNTLVATDLSPEYGRENVFQITREKSDSTRHQLPATLGGRPFGPGEGHDALEQMVQDGWTFHVTPLSDEFTVGNWRAEHPESHVLGYIPDGGSVQFLRGEDRLKDKAKIKILSLRPPEGQTQPPADAVG